MQELYIYMYCAYADVIHASVASGESIGITDKIFARALWNYMYNVSNDFT